MRRAIGQPLLMEKTSSANKLTNEIIDFIYRAGGYAWKQSSVGVFDSKQAIFRASAKKGVSDILDCFRTAYRCRNQNRQGPVKSRTGRVSDERERRRR